MPQREDATQQVEATPARGLPESPSSAVPRLPSGRAADVVGFLAATGDEDRARVVHGLHRTVGNRAVARLLAQPDHRGMLARWDVGGLVGGVVDAFAAVASGRIEASVGRNGRNQPIDVMVVQMLLVRAGRGGELEDEIERYQREVVGLKKPDGRVDPNGRTLQALRGAGGSAAPTTPAGPADPVPAAPTVPADPVAPSGGGGGTGGAPASAAEIAAMISQLAITAAADPKKSTEAEGPERDTLVRKIRDIRSAIDRLADPGEKAKLYAQLNAVTPSYYQSRNMDLLEMPPPGDTRTCNISSVAMCLEALGRTAAEYTGSREAVVAVAKVYKHVVDKAEDAKDKTGDKLNDLRLPDFLQLAAIAEVVGSKALTEANIKGAAVQTEADEQGKIAIIGGAWKKITESGFLQKLSQRFTGVKATSFTHEHDDALTKIGSAHRSHVEKLADLRNDRERLATMQPGTPQYKELEKQIAAAERSTKGFDDLSGKSLESQEKALPIQRYRESVTGTLGAELARGNQVVCNLYNHYVRLESVADTHVVVDDPARGTRANRKLTWEEARGMGYFRKAIILSG